MILTLSANEFLRLSRARGTTVEVLDGRVWITEAGNARDAIVSPGMRYDIAGTGLVVVESDGDKAAGPSRISVRPPVWRVLWDRATVLVKKCADGIQERRTMAELERLSDRSLRDIGLVRDQIESAARRERYL
jgi:uncharacterized protein YjiS (DUF1127 family)